MLTTAYTQNLATHFQRSHQFYYFLTDLRGYYIYTNPLFQKHFAHTTADFYGAIAADTFIAADAEKYKLAIRQCLQKPDMAIHTELNIKLQDGSFLITQWEFSACSGDNNIPENIQAIGFAVKEMGGPVKVNEEISEQKNSGDQKSLSQELIEQEIQKQKQLVQATIDGQEKERLEIGKELHDNINQHLTITRLYLEVAREKAAGEMLEMINLAHKNLAGVINEIRQMSQSLVPPTLGDLGLIESVLDLCDSLQRTHTFNIDFLYRHFTEEQLPDNLKLMFFRIIQEQVNNIIRHASANNIRIRLQSDAEYIILTIEDDGHGFDPASYKKGQGISNISNRAGLFNGRVEIDSAPGKGCTITVIVPQEQPEKVTN